VKRPVHPYDQLTGGQWLRGQPAHPYGPQRRTASAAGGGSTTIAERGYDFLMLSRPRPASPTRPSFDSRGMIMLCGSETSIKDPHLQHIHSREVIDLELMGQQAIDASPRPRCDGDRQPPPTGTASFDHCSNRRSAHLGPAIPASRSTTERLAAWTAVPYAHRQVGHASGRGPARMGLRQRRTATCRRRTWGWAGTSPTSRQAHARRYLPRPCGRGGSMPRRA